MAIRYKPVVYRKQGATELVVAAGGQISVESEAIVGMESGSTLQIQSGGYISVESGGIVNYESGGLGEINGTAAIPDANGRVYGVQGFKKYLEVGSTTGLSNYGVSILSSALDSGGLFFPIAGPLPGVEKTIIKCITAGMEVIRGNTSAGSTITFDSNGSSACYINLSTNYCVINMIGNAAGTKYLVTSIAYKGSSLTSDVIFATTS